MNEQIEKSIIADYLNGKTINELRKIYRVGFKKLNLILENNNIEKRKAGYHQTGDKHFRYKSTKDYDEDSIINDYLDETIQVKEILSKYSIHFRTLSKILEENNISKRLEVIKNDLFDNLNSDSAYFLGILLADGSINDKGNITLGMTDKDVLEKFAQLLGLSEKRINRYSFKNFNHKPKYTINFTSYDSLIALKKFGIVPNKTYNHIEPKCPKKLLPSFLRGIFDGDGCFYISNNKKSDVKFFIAGNDKTINFYVKSLYKLGYKGKYSLYERTKNCTVLQIGGKNQVNQVLNLIKGYPNMDRKWNKIKLWQETLAL